MHSNFVNKNLPVLGLSTCYAENEEIYHAVKHAVKIGYRHFDLAPRYGNQKQIGLAIKECIQDGLVKREDLVITSKLYHTCHQPNLVKKQLDDILEETGLDYLDYFMMHAPWAFKPLEENKVNLEPLHENGNAVIDKTE